MARLGSVQAIEVDFREREGKLSATVDVPERGLVGMPAETVEYTPPTLRLKFLYGDASLRVDAETEEMTGVIPAWQPVVRIHLKRAEMPAPDFREEEVRFPSGSLSLAGTLVQPLGPGLHPALVLVQGSAVNTRTEPGYRSKAIFFARHGFAALIYDKRPGYDETATFSDLADDAAAAVRYLKARKDDIDGRHLGLAGYSQGGWLAPLAASRVEGVAFLVLQVAPAVSVEEQEIERVRYGMASDGFSEEDVARAAAYTRKVFDAAYRGADWAALAAATEKAKGTKWAEQVQLVTSPDDLEGWRRQRYDPAAVLRKTMIPVLVLYGAADTLVPPSENAELMRHYLEEAGNRDVTDPDLPPGEPQPRMVRRPAHRDVELARGLLGVGQAGSRLCRDGDGLAAGAPGPATPPPIGANLTLPESAPTQDPHHPGPLLPSPPTPLTGRRGRKARKGHKGHKGQQGRRARPPQSGTPLPGRGMGWSGEGQGLRVLGGGYRQEAPAQVRSLVSRAASRLRTVFRFAAL